MSCLQLCDFYGNLPPNAASDTNSGNKALTRQRRCGTILFGVMCAANKLMEIPKYRCAGPVQQDTVNHVRRETEQH